jgi:hypothetical protein
MACTLLQASQVPGSHYIMFTEASKEMLGNYIMSGIYERMKTWRSENSCTIRLFSLYSNGCWGACAQHEKGFGEPCNWSRLI